MKTTLICFGYCLLTVLYAWYPFEANKYLYLANLANILGFIALLCHIALSGCKHSETDKLFIQFSMWLSISRILYTAYCVFMNKAWILFHTDVYNVLIAISLAIVSINCALKKT